MNIGELNEIKIKLRLIELRDKNMNLPILGNKLVSSVGFAGIEFKSLPQNVNLLNLSDNECIELGKKVGATKAGIYDKADVLINGIPYSIKSLETAPPALVNHTARHGWERICNVIGCSIDELDTIIENYWDLRQKGIIGEDINNDDPHSPFYNHKEYLIPLLNYFLFKGTGARESKNPADYILDFTHPFLETTWKIHGNEYLVNHWDKLVFSVRSKKGMGNYPNIKDAIKKNSMAKWTKLFQGSYKGALHVRVK